MEAISKQWATADAPAILLSGGLDSRYIVSAIAEIVSDTTKLQLVTWGVPEYRRFSDLEVSKQIACRLGAKHIILERTEEKIVEELEETFQLIGCEVDSFFHVNERLLLAMLRQRHGISSLFRGEEAFGWGEYRKNLKYALNQIIVSYPEDNPWLKEIFCPAFYEKMLEGWHKRLKEILREYHHQSVNDLKDSLYFNWRLARYLSTLSYFKLAYIEQFNPLLDFGVIEFNQRVPTRLRVDKKLFRMAFRAKQSLLNGIPLATRNNLENWEKVIRRNPVIFKYVREKLEIENEIFKNAGHLSTSLVRASGTNGPQPGDRIRNLFQYHPFIRQTKLFGALNELRHLYVKPPQETVRVKLLFRAAQVKDFLHRYWS
jgi:asparagine synthetase B (glutamine-hydrolysing)